MYVYCQVLEDFAIESKCVEMWVFGIPKWIILSTENVHR